MRELTSTPETIQAGVFDGAASSVATVASGETFSVRTRSITEQLGPGWPERLHL